MVNQNSGAGLPLGDLVLTFNHEQPITAAQLGELFAALARDYRQFTSGRSLVVTRIESGSLIALLQDAIVFLAPHLRTAVEVAKAIKGFETKTIRSRLDARGLSYEKSDGTILLLERLSIDDKKSGSFEKFEGLRTVQMLRSKAKGHASAESGDMLAKEARMNHESFANHFNTVCETVVSELDQIHSMFESKV